MPSAVQPPSGWPRSVAFAIDPNVDDTKEVVETVGSLDLSKTEMIVAVTLIVGFVAGEQFVAVTIG